MQFILEAPSSLETAQLEMEGNTMQMVPRVLKGATHIRVAYLTARGDNGAEVRTILLFSPKRKAFMLQQVTEDPVTSAFDTLPPAKPKKRPKLPDTVQEGQQDAVQAEDVH